MKVSKFFTILLVLLSLTFNANAAGRDIGDYSSSPKAKVEADDPFEDFNRVIFKINDAIDKAVILPVAKTYQKIVPKFVRKSVGNALRNLTEPVTFVNSTLQGDFHHSAVTFWRFAINSTLGIGGLFDIAGIEGLEYRKEDFGQTLGVHQMEQGPYIVLPILGPSNARDTIGIIVDIFTDPFNYTFTSYGTTARGVTQGIHFRSSTIELTEEIERISFDPYSTIRSIYTQKRSDDIKNTATHSSKVAK